MHVMLMKMMKLLCMQVRFLTVCAAAAFDVMHTRAARSGVHGLEHWLKSENIPEITTPCRRLDWLLVYMSM